MPGNSKTVYSSDLVKDCRLNQELNLDIQRPNMDVRRLFFSGLAASLLCGCTVSGSSKKTACEKDDSVNIGPLIGLIGMAVDGDDKDDYEHFFDDHKHSCKCKKCRH